MPAEITGNSKNAQEYGNFIGDGYCRSIPKALQVIDAITASRIHQGHRYTFSFNGRNATFYLYRADS